MASNQQQKVLAVIGGTGLSALKGLEIEERKLLQTPFGEPSGEALVGRFQGEPVVFLPRHGHAHSIPPHQINYRANLWQLRQLGVSHIVAVNAVGGIHPQMGPGHLCLPDQLIDYSYGREHTFYDGSGRLAADAGGDLMAASVEHIDFTFPYSEPLRELLKGVFAQSALEESSVTGVYGCTQGPRLETAAEISRLQRDGCDLVGMTGMPEAALARELNIEYASVCLVVNWAAGLSADPITMADIQRVLGEGMNRVCEIIHRAAAALNHAD